MGTRGDGRWKRGLNPTLSEGCVTPLAGGRLRGLHPTEQRRPDNRTSGPSEYRGERMRVLSFVWFVVVLSAGCGDEQAASNTAEASAASTPTMSSSSTSKPNVQTSATSKVVEVKEAPSEKQVVQAEEKALAPETPEQVQAQCQGLLKSAWKGLGPAFNALQIENYAALESDYVTGYDGRKLSKYAHQP